VNTEAQESRARLRRFDEVSMTNLSQFYDSYLLSRSIPKFSCYTVAGYITFVELMRNKSYHL